MPNLSLNIYGLRKQSISHADLVHGKRYTEHNESIDNGEKRKLTMLKNKSVLSKPPISERLNRNGQLLLLEEREMPITRDRQTRNGDRATGDMNRMTKNGSPSFSRAGGNHAERLKIR